MPRPSAPPGAGLSREALNGMRSELHALAGKFDLVAAAVSAAKPVTINVDDRSGDPHQTARWAAMEIRMRR